MFVLFCGPEAQGWYGTNYTEMDKVVMGMCVCVYVCVCVVVQTDTQRVKGKERRIATQKEVAVNCPCINMRIEAQLLNYVQTDVK